MVRRPCGGTASRRTQWYLQELPPQEESNRRSSGLLGDMLPLYHLLAAILIQCNLVATTKSLTSDLTQGNHFDRCLG